MDRLYNCKVAVVEPQRGGYEVCDVNVLEVKDRYSWCACETVITIDKQLHSISFCMWIKNDMLFTTAEEARNYIIYEL